MTVDALIVGAGHNGLTCACYLAAAGLSVRILERRPIVGGAAVTEEFHPGFRNSSASYTVSLLQPRIIRDLRLAEHGLTIVERPFSNFLPLPDGRYFKLGGTLSATRIEAAKFSRRDAERLPAYFSAVDRIADVLRDQVLRIPPNVAAGTLGGLDNLTRSLRFGQTLRRLDAAGRADLLDLFTKSAGELLDHWFEGDALKAALGFDSVVGNFVSPYSPGCAYGLLHHGLGEVNGQRGRWGHAIGGMGAITTAMAKEAIARGVKIDLEAPVARVITRAGRATGVVLADGREIAAPAVIANVTPRVLFEQLVDRDDLPEGFRQRMARYRMGSGSFRMNVALAELPDFTALPGRNAQPHHASGIVIAPSLGYMEQAYFDARTEGWSRAPIVEILIPSVVDDTLAPHGAHVASIIAQQFSPHLPDGRSWDHVREDAASAILATIDRYAPNFKASVLGMKILSPLDLEREFGLTNGDIMHGALALDQLFAARPLVGYADHRMPIEGLYLCGAGAHPGGGVSGAPGHNAAEVVIRDLRRRR